MFYTHLFSPYNYVTTPKLFRLRDVGSSKQLSPKNLVAGTHPQLRVKLFSFGKILYHDQPSTRVEPSVPEPSGKCFGKLCFAGKKTHFRTSVHLPPEGLSVTVLNGAWGPDAAVSLL